VKILDVSLLKYVVQPSPTRETEDMNIQGPLLLLGMTATTGVGLGTIAVNSGAIDIEDVSGLLADTTNAVSGPVAGAANPFGSTSAPGAPQITASQTAPVLEPSLAEVTTAATSDVSIATAESGDSQASSGSNSGSSHGTSSGSTGGSYEDEDEDDDEDEDEDDHEDDDDDRDEDEGDDD